MFCLRLYLCLTVLFSSFSSASFAKDFPICINNPVAPTQTTASTTSININTASFDELSSKLKGIGKAKAAAIIEWRETNGKFSSLEDVDEVRGIGPAILEKNRALIRFED
ncbi:MAG: ComEA family DNA-binding protein [Moraxellaceae bacterium]|nr:ComEA family DNA-binding protein [Pseudomonadales bacterium]MCB1673191.1 ComEA family DNA-binding protein [Pseudomonadales bacterium]MCP5175660.1 ComEA family DNA-binding protein [Moraxellaceae bacterium]MCP5175934.1 ComEA family DNA-binding protein [Moraxellaceae bacterium]HQV21521.1 ComEA family DNA-binding protein [Agitococcus sp.]